MAIRPAIALFAHPFYFLRHGETASNALGIVAGSTDVPLTALGAEQARAAAEALRKTAVSAIYSSPLMRARHTAEPIAKVLRLPVTILPELAERNWGELEGKPRGLRVRGVSPPGGETSSEFALRVLAGLGKIDDNAPLIVSHSGVFRLLCRTLGIAEAEAPVTNAQTVRFLPPAAGQSDWALEVLSNA